MVQPLISNKEANSQKFLGYKISLTALELEFMVFQMEASIDACRLGGVENVEENSHFQGLERILKKFRNALPPW